MEGVVREVTLDSTGTWSFRIEIFQALQVSAGRYLLGSSRTDLNEPFPVALFPLDEGVDYFSAVAIQRPDWKPGEELQLRGPLGRGFTIRKEHHKICLIARGIRLHYLHLLIKQYLASGANLVLCTEVHPADIHPVIEIQPYENSLDAAAWADASYLVTDAGYLEQDLKLIGAESGSFQFRELVEVLVLSEMPCGGTADCGVCSVVGRRGWLFPCSKGPVFQVNKLMRLI
jgi:hypothetical protein